MSMGGVTNFRNISLSEKVEQNRTFRSPNVHHISTLQYQLLIVSCCTPLFKSTQSAQNAPINNMV